MMKKSEIESFESKGEFAAHYAVRGYSDEPGIGQNWVAAWYDAIGNINYWIDPALNAYQARPKIDGEWDNGRPWTPFTPD
jgi:hypothetical protein